MKNFAFNRISTTNFELNKISITQISMAKRCEMALYHALTQPRAKKSVWLFIGTVFHSVLEIYFKKKAQGENLTWQGLIPYFEQIFTQNANMCDFEAFGEQQAKHICHNYLYDYYQARCGVLYPRSADEVEVFFGFNAKQGEQKIRITGKADLITKDGTIVDHKTGRMNNDWQLEPQGHLYPLGLRANGYAVRGFQFSCVDKQGCEVFEVQEDKAKQQELLNYVFQLQRAFKDNNLFANLKNCKRCEWAGICERKGGD